MSSSAVTACSPSRGAFQGHAQGMAETAARFMRIKVPQGRLSQTIPVPAQQQAKVEKALARAQQARSAIMAELMS